jgi:erythromycin esterase-like protein
LLALAAKETEGEKPCNPTVDPTLIDAVREGAHPLTGAAEAYDPLMDLAGDARFVLLGEASH